MGGGEYEKQHIATVGKREGTLRVMAYDCQREKQGNSFSGG